VRFRKGEERIGEYDLPLWFPMSQVELFRDKPFFTAIVWGGGGNDNLVAIRR
jgi:hypothetical protein